MIAILLPQPTPFPLPFLATFAFTFYDSRDGRDLMVKGPALAVAQSRFWITLPLFDNVETRANTEITRLVLVQDEFVLEDLAEVQAEPRDAVVHVRLEKRLHHSVLGENIEQGVEEKLVLEMSCGLCSAPRDVMFAVTPTTPCRTPANWLVGVVFSIVAA